MPCSRWNVGSTMFGSSSRTFVNVGSSVCEVGGGRRPASSSKSWLLTFVEAERRRASTSMLRAMYGCSLRRLGRLHLEALHERRVDRAGDDGDERPQADGDDRQHPAPLPDVDDEQDAAPKRDEDQQLDRRQLRVDVGVGGAVDDARGSRTSSS